MSFQQQNSPKAEIIVKQIPRRQSLALKMAERVKVYETRKADLEK